MDKLIPKLSLLCFLIVLAPTKVANSTKSSLSICSQTPYPELCNSLTIIPKSTQTTLDETSSSYNVRDASLKFTLAQAQYVHNLISSTDTTSFDKLTKAAWSDCLELYQDTINNLARCSSSTNNFKDVQTWLSAANANHETCKNGFIDFQLHSQLQSFPFFNTNFSKHLSNSLAINKISLTSSLSSNQVYTNHQTQNRKLLSLDSDDFPEWVSTGDRKLLQSSATPDITVAQDGSGDYKTISEALAASKRSGSGRFVIYVKGGVYKENVVVTGSNIMMVGDGIGSTVVTGSKNVQDGSTTFSSATFAVVGDKFIAQDMTFENTAGPAKHQAVALRSGSDFSVFYRCGFKGYQDTLYVYSKRQFYRDCDISGTIDFIFGDAVVVFQSCNINLRQPMSGQVNTVTASGRSDANENTGIIIHNSQISGSGVSAKSYLGRPWQKCSRTVIMRSGISGAIDSAGWLPWSGNFALNTLYYAEYANTGAGAGTGGRVKWGGYHVLTSPADAQKFSVGNFLAGNSWIPSTGVPFTAGL